MTLSCPFRLVLCRRDEPLPSRRVADLLRVSSVALAACLFTQVAEWVAVALGRHRGDWNMSTTWQILLLALLTVSTVGAGVLTLRAVRAVDRTTVCAAQPDWLSDLITRLPRGSWNFGGGPIMVRLRCCPHLASRVRQSWRLRPGVPCVGRVGVGGR
jgi:hypothetical protein